MHSCQCWASNLQAYAGQLQQQPALWVEEPVVPRSPLGHQPLGSLWPEVLQLQQVYGLAARLPVLQAHESERASGACGGSDIGKGLQNSWQVLMLLRLSAAPE